MSIIATTFASIAEADAINTVSPWSVASGGAKQTALEWAAVYMILTYDVQEGEKDASLVTANSMFAQSHMGADLFLAANVGKNPLGLTQKTVKAEVESSKSFDARMAARWQDPFPHISAMLSAAGFALRNSNSSMKTVPLARR